MHTRPIRNICFLLEYKLFLGNLEPYHYTKVTLCVRASGAGGDRKPFDGPRQTSLFFSASVDLNVKNRQSTDMGSYGPSRN